MNKKLKSILNSLEASPEIKEKKCVTKVRQLRSAYANFEHDDGRKIDTLKNRITRLCISLYAQVSDPYLKKGLSMIQSECDKFYNDITQDSGVPDFSLSWNSEDD